MITETRRSLTADSSRPKPDDPLADFESFYRANVRTVYSFAAQRLGQSDAEDVTAEVFHAAAIAHRDGLGQKLTTAWVVAVCKNKVIDRWRSETTRKAKAHLVKQRFAASPAAPVDAPIDLRNGRVLDALDSVSARHRTLLVLHYVDSVPIAELAEATGQSRSSVESALARARRSFRRAYDAIEEGVE